MTVNDVVVIIGFSKLKLWATGAFALILNDCGYSPTSSLSSLLVSYRVFPYQELKKEKFDKEHSTFALMATIIPPKNMCSKQMCHTIFILKSEDLWTNLNDEHSLYQI